MYYFFKILLFIPLRLICFTKLKNKNLLPSKGEKLIIVSNHQSNWDIVVLMFCLPYKIRFVAKKELGSSKFMHWFLKSMGAIFVDRDNVSIESIKEIMKALKNNEVLMIFPEGTRNKTEELLLDFKEGIERFALKTNAPILITAISRKVRPFKVNKLTIIEKYECLKDVDNLKIIKEKILNTLKGEQNERNI